MAGVTPDDVNPALVNYLSSSMIGRLAGQNDGVISQTLAGRPVENFEAQGLLYSRNRSFVCNINSR